MFKRYENLADMYHQVGKLMFMNGEKVYPRGMETLELIAPVLHIENPRGRLAYLPARKFNIVYAVVESLMLFQKEDKLKYFSEFNTNMKNFSDDGVHLHGAYGNRFANHITDIVQKLKEDKDSRQAILTIYNNDCRIKTKDIPCTLNIHFLIRNDKLNMIVYMRSNDIIWGTPYDVFMFTMLQQVVANELGIDIGWYKHIPSSLHVYEQHYDMLHDMSFRCENVEFDNPFNYKEFKALSADYINVIDDEEEMPKFKNTYMQQYKNIILNEKCFRDKDWASENGISITDNVPSWTRLFTKRWYR